ncbi:hypothetical protein DMN91_011422 [Ooceraea biroi]|uniref:Uncharacterized protein n=1 Tax=Ooceraea biroi TaxID=2015173 RepID=A0A3L8D720_OOCBI|nr:hypothetical protein DMN91_011422 [Ooceraea biroi]
MNRWLRQTTKPLSRKTKLRSEARFASDKRRKVSGGRWKRQTSSGDIKIAAGYTRRAAIIALPPLSVSRTLKIAKAIIIIMTSSSAYNAAVRYAPIKSPVTSRTERAAQQARPFPSRYAQQTPPASQLSVLHLSAGESHPTF